MSNKRMLSILALGLFAAAAPIQAHSGATLVEDRFKTALNGVVRKVHGAEDPAAKRKALVGWTEHMDRGLGRAAAMESLSEADRAGLSALRNRFVAYKAELEGREGLARVEDGELDRFASYMQQDLEQAPVGGGIYLSAGAIIIILLLLLIVT